MDREAVPEGENSQASAGVRSPPCSGGILNDSGSAEISREEITASPLVTFIVPVRNERDAIEDCIAALLAQDLPEDQIEVVVAEGRSSDGTRAVLEGLAAADSRLKVVDNPTGRTPDALNAAIEASRGRFIGRIDGHSLVARNHAARCLSALKETNAWCVGGPMRQQGLTQFGQAAAAAARSRFGVGDSAFHYANQRQSVETVFLGFWPRWVFERIGLFDPELLRNQDDEFSYRIRAAGGTVWFDPEVETTYQPRETWRKLFDQYRQYGRYKVRVFQKRPGAARLRHLIPAAFVGSLLLGPLGLLVPWVTVGSIAAAATYLGINIVVSARLARISRVAFLDIASAFAAMHLGYGLGFWQGAVLYAPRWFKDRSGPPIPALKPHG